MESRKGICWLRLVAVLSSVLMAMPLAGAAARPVPQDQNTSEVKSQTLSVGETNSTPGRNSGREQPTKTGHEVSEDDIGQPRNSASIKWLAPTSSVSTAMAYGFSVAVNFLTVVVLVVLFSRSRLPAFFRNRTQVIRHGLYEARKTSAEAQQRLSAVESRLAKLQSEMEAMQSAAGQESRWEEARLHSAAEEERRKIVYTAEREIITAVNLAKCEFKSYAIELAVTLAANNIQVDTSTDEGLLRSFVDRQRRNGNN